MKQPNKATAPRIASIALALIGALIAPVNAVAQAEPTQSGAPTVLQEGKDERPALKEYDLGKKNLAIGGYDPVAYFPAHGGKATKGSKSFQTVHRGVLYHFASEKNKKAFLASPEAFEPMYGGWCAWAIADGKGSKTEPNPKSFTIEDGRLYLFYDGFFGDTRKSWNNGGGAPKLKSTADKNWTRISGEPARVDPKPEPKPAPAPAPEKKGE